MNTAWNTVDSTTYQTFGMNGWIQYDKSEPTNLNISLQLKSIYYYTFSFEIITHFWSIYPTL
jgi:hypothetical protein